MTLVVARKRLGTVWIVADTLITGGHENLRKPDLGLKVFALSQDTLVSYAGDQFLAHRALVMAQSQTREPCHDHVLQALESQTEVDFIVVKKDNISTIKKGSLVRNVMKAWIGDPDGSSKFQEHELNLLRNSVVEQKRQLGVLLASALQRVVDDASVMSVGGPVVVANSGKSGSAYLRQMQLTSPRFVPSEGGWRSVDFGTAVTGGYGFTTVTPTKLGISGWGIYYYQPQKGIFFSADLRKNKFEVFQGASPTAQGFCDSISANVKYDVKPCGQLGPQGTGR